MRDAFGGVTNLVIIVAFLALVSGYLAFNVNYTKAFRVKNKIISTFEQYEGNCDSGQREPNTCNGEIINYMKSIGYSAPSFRPANDETYDYICHDGYCYAQVEVANTNSDTGKKAYFKVVTQINIDIPIINKILPKIFQVSGDTKPMMIIGG